MEWAEGASVLNWFTRKADVNEQREIVALPITINGTEWSVRFEIRVRFDADGTYIYEPEESIINAAVQNPADDQWYPIKPEDLAKLQADKAIMEAMYAQAITTTPEEEKVTPEDEAKNKKVQFENSTVAQIGQPYLLVAEWWKTVPDAKKVKILNESEVIDRYLSFVADNVAGMTMLDVKDKEKDFYMYMKERQLEGGGVRKRRQPAAEAPAEPVPSEAPAAPAA